MAFSNFMGTLSLAGNFFTIFFAYINLDFRVVESIKRTFKNGLEFTGILCVCTSWVESTHFDSVSDYVKGRLDINELKC